MKKHITLIVAVISCLLCAVCLYRISELNNEIKNLQGSYNNGMNDISRSISRIYSTIDAKLEEQANLVASTEAEYGELSIENKTVSLKYSIVPKEYSDKTTVFVVCNDVEYPMTLENGKFTAEITLPLFEESKITAVKLINDGIIQTQADASYYTPKGEFLPSLYTNYYGSSSLTRKDGNYVQKYNGQFEINFNCNTSFTQVQTIYLIEVLDGEVISKTEIPKNTTAFQINTSNGHSTATVVYPDNQETTTYYFLVDNDPVIPSGSTYELYVEVVDNHNLHHVRLADKVITHDDGPSPEFDELYHHLEALIYDENGNLLYAPDGEEYGVDFKVTSYK